MCASLSLHVAALPDVRLVVSVRTCFVRTVYAVLILYSICILSFILVFCLDTDFLYTVCILLFFLVFCLYVQ